MSNINYTEVLTIDNSFTGNDRLIVEDVFKRLEESVDGQLYLRKLKEVHGEGNKIIIKNVDFNNIFYSPDAGRRIFDPSIGIGGGFVIDPDTNQFVLTEERTLYINFNSLSTLVYRNSANDTSPDHFSLDMFFRHELTHAITAHLSNTYVDDQNGESKLLSVQTFAQEAIAVFLTNVYRGLYTDEETRASYFPSQWPNDYNVQRTSGSNPFFYENLLLHPDFDLNDYSIDDLLNVIIGTNGGIASSVQPDLYVQTKNLILGFINDLKNDGLIPEQGFFYTPEQLEVIKTQFGINDFSQTTLADLAQTVGEFQTYILFDENNNERHSYGWVTGEGTSTETLEFFVDEDGEFLRRVIYGEVPNLQQGRVDLFGTAGANTIYGYDGDNHLYGSGDEEVWDDNAPDILVGGNGFDTYYVGNGDIIEDSDGLGAIKYQNSANQEVEVSNRTYTLLQGNLYESDDDVKLRVQLTASNTLLVLGEKTFEIHNFQSGHFNITLDGVPEEIIYDNLIIGTEDDDGLSDLTGSPLNDEIRALGGDDVADGGAGDDLIFGGDGDDRLHGGEGNDILYGEAGQDVLDGGAGNDILDGGADTDILLGGTGDDVLDGGDGIDLLIGGEGRNVLFGGEGVDLLIAQGNATVGSNWEFTLSPQGQFVLNDIQLDPGMLISGLFVPTGDTGSSLFGEGGNDVLIGSNGNDLLDGGDGNDVIEAGDGDDVLNTDVSSQVPMVHCNNRFNEYKKAA